VVAEAGTAAANSTQGRTKRLEKSHDGTEDEPGMMGIARRESGIRGGQ
jgi:hypothetical protein